VAAGTVPKNAPSLLCTLLAEEINALSRAYESPTQGGRVYKVPGAGSITIPYLAPVKAAVMVPGSPVSHLCPEPLHVTFKLPLDIDDIMGSGPEYAQAAHDILHRQDVLAWDSGECRVESQYDIRSLMHRVAVRYKDPWLGNPVWACAIPDEHIEHVLAYAAERRMYAEQAFRSIQDWREETYAPIIARLDYEVNNDFPDITD